MNALKLCFACLIAVSLFAACEEESAPLAFQPRFKELSNCKNGICIGPLVIPDSIDKSLVAVTYYENAPRIAHSLIVYDDSLKKTATCMKYFADTGIFVDKLGVMGYQVFRSISDTCRSYRIKDSTVSFVHDKHSIVLNWEYKRTDNPPPPSLLRE